MTPAADTRTQIMDAFGEQLAAAGYPGISLVGVARSVGIQKPSIYHHFPGGKEELYAAVALRFIEQFHDRLVAALAAEGPTEQKLRSLAAVAAEHSTRAVSFEQRIYDALDHVSDETRNTVSQRYVRDILDPVVALFTHAVDVGEVVGEPWFLMNAFLHLARATELVNTPNGAAQVVVLFLEGARPR